MSCQFVSTTALPIEVKTSPTLNIYLLEYLTGGRVLPRVLVPLRLLCAICPLLIVLLLCSPIEQLT